MLLNLDKNKKLFDYRPDVDGIRAIAIILIVAFHAFPDFVKGGLIGVDIFFVISGYLISGIILKSLLVDNFSFVDFYKRRIKRIFPSLIIVLMSCLIFGWFILFAQEYKILGKHIVGGASFLSNIFYLLESGYFDTSSTLKPLLNLWSLGVEEQFYIFWPILLVFLYKKSKQLIRFTFIILIISFVLNIFIGQSNPVVAFYLPVTRWWELMSGSILAQIVMFHGGFFDMIFEKIKKTVTDQTRIRIKEISSVVGVLFLITSLLIINENNFYQGWVFLSIIGTFLLIAPGPETWINRKVLSNKTLVFVGLISYPLYLWHWPLFSFANIITAGSVTLKLKFILIILSFFLAWATYKLVERPIRFGKIRLITMILCWGLVFSGSMGAIVYFNNGFDFRFSSYKNMINSVTVKIKKQDMNSSLCKKKYPQKTYLNHYCYISESGPKKIFIIGDSHTIGIYNAYAKSLNDVGYTVVNRGLAGCPGIYMSPNKKHCNEDYKKVIDSILLDNPAGIVISNNYHYTKPDLFELSMKEVLSYFSKDIPIVWVLQTPRIKYDLMSCLNRPFDLKKQIENCSIWRADSEDKIIEHNEIIKNLKKEYSNLITVNPYDILCDQEKCPIIIDNKFLYEDNNFHLSIFGGNYLAQRMPIYHFFKDVSIPQAK